MSGSDYAGSCRTNPNHSSLRLITQAGHSGLVTQGLVAQGWSLTGGRSGREGSAARPGHPAAGPGQPGQAGRRRPARALRRLGPRSPGTHMLDLAQRFPEVRQPGVLVLPDQPDAPCKRITAAARDAGLDESVQD